MRGGYQLVNFNGIALTSGVKKTVSGVYDAIKNTTKATVVTGLVVGATTYKDFEVLFTASTTSFVGIATTTAGHTIAFLVENDNGVTVTVS